MLLKSKGNACLCIGIATALLIYSGLNQWVGSSFFPFANAKKVDLEQGDKLTIKLIIDDPTSVKELSLRARTVQDSDSFKESYSRIPITVEIRDKGKVVGSDSMTAHMENSFKSFDIDLNNDPKVSGTFSAIISFDILEDNGCNPKIRVDTDNIEIIDDKKNDLDFVRIE